MQHVSLPESMSSSMQKKLLFMLIFLFGIVPSAYAQSNNTFDSIESCRNLKAKVSAAVEEAKPIDALLRDENMATDTYLEQLYQSIQILSKSGEMFFKASDEYESDCQTALTQAGQLAEMRKVYDWYLEPVKQAYQFFRRAKAIAIHQNRQKDVETFVKAMREYEDSVMKIAATCESTLEGTPAAASCRQLSSKLEDALKGSP